MAQMLELAKMPKMSKIPKLPKMPNWQNDNITKLRKIGLKPKNSKIGKKFENAGDAGNCWNLCKWQKCYKFQEGQNAEIIKI